MASIIEKPTLWDESGTQSARIQAELLQQVKGGPIGYRLRRVILTNFWLYEHQVIEIPHGRLFLAGDNQSGKSTVLIAAITLALDGDTHPERIDTFGKREKRIDYYVIGSNESNTPFLRDQRTSYIALEFEWCSPELPPFSSEARTYWERGEFDKARFLTIGLALYGNRNNATPISISRFLITDGSRLEKDIHTIHTQGDTSRATDLRTFKKIINEHGIVCDTQREYEQKVSQYLFNFANVEDFHRLIRLLLYLRQPNLNSVLSLETIRSYLDQSLPALPGDLIQNAATTIELMDALQAEIERRKKAYSAVERLHQAQQIVTMGHSRIAAYQYLQDQLKSSEAQREVQRLKRTITRAENELRQQQTKLEELRREQQEVTGQVAALQESAELRTAQSLAEARQSVAEQEKDFQEKVLLLEDTIGRREQTEQEQETQRKLFQELRQLCTEQLQDLQRLAQKEAHWELVADQLSALYQQVKQFTLEAETPPFSTQISSLQTFSVEERLRWLRTLKDLHHEIETTTIQLQVLQKQETAAYQAFDQASRTFDSQREQCIDAQQTFADTLELLFAGNETWRAPLTELNERAALIWNETAGVEEIVAHLGALVNDYNELYNTLQEALRRTREQIQQALQQALSEQGAKRELVIQAQQAYEQKRQEPEYTPPRSAHRQQARRYLAEHGIAAQPFYTLVDFASDIDSQSPFAGGIEQALEDAGLLDALVVAPADSAKASALLASAGLSDCYLDITQFTQPAEQPTSATTTSLLRIDPALQEVPADYERYAANCQAIIQTLESSIYPKLVSSRDTTSGATWQHGLLSGTTGQGTARSIGKANRIREQQQVIEALYQRWQALNAELATIEEHIQALTQQQQEQETLLNRLDTAHQESVMESQWRELQSAQRNRNEADAAYQRLRSEAQTLRIQVNTLKTRLVREAEEVPLFANSTQPVEQAYEVTQRLASEYKNIHNNLDRFRSSFSDYKKIEQRLAQDKGTEWRLALLKQKDEEELVQGRARLQILEQYAQQTTQADIAALARQLEYLLARQNDLPEELQHARTRIEVLQGSTETQQESYQTAQSSYTQLQHVSDESYQYLLARMEMYPVEMLNAIKQEMALKTPPEIAQSVLAEPLAAPEESYTQQSKLEGNRNKAQNALYQITSEVNNLLHDYGPRYDEQGIIHFVNVDDANSLELLMRLGEEIKQHEQLLDIRERELFQNFLLQEMADTVGKHIIAAEQWVKRMNEIFSQTEFVGSYYQLKWSIKKQEQIQSGSRLSHYHELLRRQVQTFKQEEIDALVYAFRQEINQLRAQAQTQSPSANSSSTFTETLATIFDYRNWFQFEISMSRPDGTWQHLTNRFMKKGSGAEQYVALYIPFFAALSALYESAGQGAPRLIALDEAFDKVSERNTRNLLQFLAAQQFQWIMTGPHITGEGAQISACVKYTMFSQKEAEIAAGFPSFWSTDLSLKAPEEYEEREESGESGNLADRESEVYEA